MSRHLIHFKSTWGAEQRHAVQRYSAERKEAILRRMMAPENNAGDTGNAGHHASFSRSRVSNGNAFAGSLCRTCKYRPNYPSKPFDSVEEARQWTLEFVQWYNHQHKHSGIKFVTPAQRHDGRDGAILQHRKQVYEVAKERRPELWSRDTRNWEQEDEVWLIRNGISQKNYEKPHDLTRHLC